MISSLCLAVLVAPLLVAAAPSAKRCTGTISSLSDVNSAVACTTVNINSFTVPTNSQFNLALLDGTTVNLMGDVTFANKTQNAPMFQISGNYITFNGNGHKFDGGGPAYWDGLGGGGGMHKPSPMMKIKMSGLFSNMEVFNSPAQAVSVSNVGPLTISRVTIDDSLGDHPNARSKGKPAGHNTDAFDVNTNFLAIQNCTIRNQDDCIAINGGAYILFQDNLCSGGHGISIGSIGSGAAVSHITIQGNTIENSDQALRIKTDASASGSTVKNITYIGNTGTKLKRFGVLIDQSYPKTLGKPGAGVKISDVNFIGAPNSLSVSDSATPIAINCGQGACLGEWRWEALATSGGSGSSFFYNAPTLSGYHI